MGIKIEPRTLLLWARQGKVKGHDIRVTMKYGDAIGEGLREASAKVAAKAIPQ